MAPFFYRFIPDYIIGDMDSLRQDVALYYQKYVRKPYTHLMYTMQIDCNTMQIDCNTM